MATGGKKSKYTGDHKVDEWLLNQVVKHVNHDEIGSFAAELRVAGSVYSNIPGAKDRVLKEDLEKECPDIMKLGQLHEVDGPQRATLREQPSYLSFTHKSLQEMEASKFVTQELEASKNIKETLKELFPSLEAVSRRYREVVLFVAGLMKDPRPLVQHVYEMQVEDYLNNMRTGDGPPSIDTDLFKSLHSESTAPLVKDPFHNKYINYFNHHSKYGDPSDTTRVYWPSRVYHFYSMSHEVELDRHTEGEEIPPCAMYIWGPREAAVRDSLLSICNEIFKHQAVTDLKMYSVTSNSLEAPRLIKPVMVFLSHCKLPDDFMEKILRQLFGSSESLQKLELIYMNLKPFESLLDELLENLVTHHERKREADLSQRKLELKQNYLETYPAWRWMEENNLDELLQNILSQCCEKEHQEAGLAQEKLELMLIGPRDYLTKLSDAFEEKWRNRCKKVESIDCTIDP